MEEGEKCREGNSRCEEKKERRREKAKGVVGWRDINHFRSLLSIYDYIMNFEEISIEIFMTV